MLGANKLMYRSIVGIICP